jgi:hypothetical protein
MLSMLTSPPRHLPLSLRVLNIFNGIAQFGWIFFGFGMIFFWAFAGNADFSFLTFRGPHERSAAKVTKVETTGASENHTQVMANHYEFSVAGSVVRGKSYSTGSDFEVGDEVTVEYDPDDPSRSRIAGMRRTMFGPWVSLVTIFEFVSRDGRRGQAIARTSQTQRLEDEGDEPLLYDPTDPTRAFMLDELPSRPTILNGELQGRPVAALLAMVLPVIAIVGHGLVLWMKTLS